MSTMSRAEADVVLHRMVRDQSVTSQEAERLVEYVGALRDSPDNKVVSLIADIASRSASATHRAESAHARSNEVGERVEQALGVVEPALRDLATARAEEVKLSNLERAARAAREGKVLDRAMDIVSNALQSKPFLAALAAIAGALASMAGGAWTRP